MTDLDHMKAALEFSRRCQKGLPSDRWADGEDGMASVARGITLMHRAMANMLAEQQERGAQSMEATADPMR